MMRSLFSAVSGLKSQQTAMDVIGNNVANVNTTGFKSSRVVFQDIYSQTLSAATAPTTTTGGINSKQVGLGVYTAGIGMNMSEGSTMNTSSPLDFSIAGEGFFVVDNGDGTYSYTRNGTFSLDSDGYLVDANGRYVMGKLVDTSTDDVKNGADVDTTSMQKIQMLGSVIDSSGTVSDTEKYTDYAVDTNGVVTATKTDSSAGTSDIVTLGRLVLATFNNSAGLEKSGDSYYSASANSGQPNYNFANYSGSGKLNSGSLEMSNVDLASELTNMIVTQRGFQANSRVITTSDSMLEELVNLKR